MFVLHLALGGCLKAPPIRFGVTADTGGHIAYLLNAVVAQAALVSVTRISIVTRLFNDAHLGFEHGLCVEPVGNKITINRVATGRRAYLEKEALAADLPAFTNAFCSHLSRLPRLPDVIHAHFADAAAVALAARERFGIPFVYTPHALGIDKRTQQPGSGALDGRIAAERCAIALADAIVVSTRDEADRQLRAYGIVDAAFRVHCLPPGIPHREQADPAASIVRRLPRWLHDPHKPIVLAIARPVRKKNLAALVRAYAAAPALADRANLIILAGQHGGGRSSAEEREVIGELAWLCADNRLHGRVALPPRHNSVDVAALYQRAALGGVFVNAALHEPFGLTLIEAAGAGVPVVATRNGGPVEIVNTLEHGLLVDPRNEVAIGMACLRIVSNADLHHRLSQAGLLNAHRYNWSTYAEHSASLYASLRCRRPKRLCRQHVAAEVERGPADVSSAGLRAVAAA
jgi:sucrose-phosphate synthase